MSDAMFFAQETPRPRSNSGLFRLNFGVPKRLFLKYGLSVLLFRLTLLTAPVRNVRRLRYH